MWLVSTQFVVLGGFGSDGSGTLPINRWLGSRWLVHRCWRLCATTCSAIGCSCSGIFEMALIMRSLFLRTRLLATPLRSSSSWLPWGRWAARRGVTRRGALLCWISPTTWYTCGVAIDGAAVITGAVTDRCGRSSCGHFLRKAFGMSTLSITFGIRARHRSLCRKTLRERSL